ncbi:hypothetical protein HHI36_012619 [Cryptolaemus montrouzieri]|uniref:Uncharacterized protein n=1 Tax=Cryptolaemus montrouzieri TaxID=559131 RepID=A0ABD2NF34_9CUCU
MFKTLILFLSLVNILEAKELPKFLRNLRCPLTHNFKPCFLKNGNAAIPLLAEGDEEYNIPKMNPFEIPVAQLTTTPMLSLNLTNLKVYGLNEMKIVDAEVDLKRREFKTSIKSSNLTIVGALDAEGRVIILPVKSKGFFSMSLINGTYNITKIDHIIDKLGDKYYKPVFEPLQYTLGKIEFKIEKLFGENVVLDEVMDKFLNENWELAMTEFGPKVAAFITDIVTDIFNSLTDVVPVRNIFLDDPVFKF